MTKIRKIVIRNFRRFRDFTLEPNNHINILVGDNETGKSTVLQAIDIVCNGSIKRIESIGLENMLNIDAVKEYLQGDHSYSSLPQMSIELYLSGEFDHTMNGKNNSDRIVCDGIRLMCEPNEDYISEIKQAVENTEDFFPYDYYKIRFSTFADEGYSSYRKKVRSVLIDSSIMNSDYATADFIKRMYGHFIENDARERATHRGLYRRMKTDFCNKALSELNNRIPQQQGYSFGLRFGSGNCFENDLMIYENNVSIENKGTGKQVFIKTDFALERVGQRIDVVLIEEPENHLSYTNLRKLVHRVSDDTDGQIFITTHNSYISTRLELQNVIVMPSDNNANSVSLKHISSDTAKFFMKAPPANMIEFALAEKTILVEGPAEYILFEEFYRICAGNEPEADNVLVLDIRGLSFKRYLEIARLTGNKVAVVTDNDKDYQTNVVNKYEAYDESDNIAVFSDVDNAIWTFEVAISSNNANVCECEFGEHYLDYMLKNKTESAFRLLSSNQPLNVPEYIRRSIEWIKG